MKICTKCFKEKEFTEFHKSPKGKNGLNSACKLCSNSRYNRAAQLFRTYGITLEGYNSLFAEQEGRCKICNLHQTELKLALAVDHCHQTGVIRGLLCSNCNTGIGLLKDSTSILQAAIRYLENINMI